MNHMITFIFTLSLVVSATCFAGITEFSSKLESLEAMYNIEFKRFLTEAELSQLENNNDKEVIDALLRIKTIFDDFSNIEEVEDINQIIDFRTFLNENLAIMNRESSINERVKLIGRYHIAKADGIFAESITDYYRELKKVKAGFMSDDKLANATVRIYRNSYADKSEADSIKEVKLKNLKAADVASIYNYFNRAVTNATKSVESQVRTKLGVTTSIEIMNAM